MVQAIALPLASHARMSHDDVRYHCIRRADPGRDMAQKTTHKPVIETILEAREVHLGRAEGRAVIVKPADDRPSDHRGLCQKGRGQQPLDLAPGQKTGVSGLCRFSVAA